MRKNKLNSATSDVAKGAISKAVLGTIGKSCPKPSSSHVLYPLKPTKDVGSQEAAAQKIDYQNSRQLRFDLQNTVIKLFGSKETPNGSTWGVHTCLRAPKSKGESVDVIYSPASELASFKNLQHCKKQICPHCAEIKARADKQQLEAMRACHLAAGGSILLLTLTNSHHKGHSLLELVEGQQRAIARFNKELSRDHFFDEFGGRVGAVRAWEATYGANGWHPHFHFLLYMNDDLVERDDQGKQLDEQPTLDIIKKSLGELWIESCKKSDLPAPDLEHGCDLRDGSHASKYVGKYGDEIINMSGGWGSSDELAKPHLKANKDNVLNLDNLKSGDKGLGIWDLLKLAHNGDKKAGDLFVEYGYAMYGKSQLYWYQGTKHLYDLESEIAAMNKAQEELIAANFEDNLIPDDRLFIALPNEIWLAVLHCDKRSQLLKTVEFDASNNDFIKKYTTTVLLNDCMKTFIDHLTKIKNDEDNKAKIAQIIRDTEIDAEIRKSGGDTFADVAVSFRNEQEKQITKRAGQGGLEIFNAINKLPINYMKSKRMKSSSVFFRSESRNY